MTLAFIFFDPIYFLFLAPGLALSLWASWLTKSTFNKYKEIPGSKGLTGAQAAQIMLERNNVHGLRIEVSQGFLSDHYNPATRSLHLSPDVYHGRSLSAIGVACHEAGHALQHAQSYALLGFRSLIVPAVGFSDNFSYIIIFAGMFMHSKTLMIAGCILFAVTTLFTIITLPVEWDASARAKVAMERAGLVSGPEAQHAGKVLNAAFLTYLAAAVSSILTLVYYLLRSGLLGGDDD